MTGKKAGHRVNTIMVLACFSLYIFVFLFLTIFDLACPETYYYIWLQPGRNIIYLVIAC